MVLEREDWGLLLELLPRDPTPDKQFEDEDEDEECKLNHDGVLGRAAVTECQVEV